MAKINLEQGKALLMSKTFWFNALTVVVAVASLFGFKEFQANTKVVEFIGFLVGAINIYLRLKTTQPITKLK